MGKHPKRTKKQEENRQRTNQDVIIHIVDTFYNLINSGNFVGVILLFLVLLSFLIVWRLPADILGAHVGIILKIFESDRYYLVVLAPTLLASLAGNFIQRKIYKTEIRRLVYLRKLLMHGRKEDLLNALEEHHPSEYDLENGE
jgi:hypothetical protein